MTATILAPSPLTLHVRVSLDDSRSEAGLRAALVDYAGALEALPALVAKAAKDSGDAPSFVYATFHTPRKKWLSERRFFERTGRFPSLDALTVRVVDALNPVLWPSDPYRGAGLWTSSQAPAGSLAIVPLALRAPEHLGALVRHLRGVDLDHETFHFDLFARLVDHHGLAATRSLIAFRALDGAGQASLDNLRAWGEGVLREALATEAGVREFAALVDGENTRSAKDHRSLYVSLAGRALLAEDPARFEIWLGEFERRGLAFEPSERKHEPEGYVRAPDFDAEWAEAADSDDRD